MCVCVSETVRLGRRFWVRISYLDGSFEAPGIIAAVVPAVHAEMAHSFLRVDFNI